jgi:hypothetical protein
LYRSSLLHHCIFGVNEVTLFPDGPWAGVAAGVHLWRLQRFMLACKLTEVRH